MPRSYFDIGIRGSVSSSPMTSTATPVSAATEQEHQHNDNQDQVHGNSPMMAIGIIRHVPSIPTAPWTYCSRQACKPQLALCGCEHFRSVLTQVQARDATRQQARVKPSLFDNGTSLRGDCWLLTPREEKSNDQAKTSCRGRSAFNRYGRAKGWASNLKAPLCPPISVLSIWTVRPALCVLDRVPSPNSCFPSKHDRCPHRGAQFDNFSNERRPASAAAAYGST
jgi:hypothetical protein